MTPGDKDDAATPLGDDERALWREADVALDRLLDLEAGRRDAAMAALPPALRERVARLLAAHDRAGPLDAPVAAPTETAVPRQIGPWTVGEVIGRGGMAVVYDAEREVAGGRQQAALKLLTVGALAADGRRRFEREHQVLARLSHPRIAALLDAGVLPDGTPWLAMQRVDGERIDQWCRQGRLDPRAIVALFGQVCEAVAHANRQLVVHRDLKPANILVDRDGHVRLLDFGIARLLDEAADAESTRTEFRALTPQYASPEQFRGEDSGTAADVFGLGAVLYQLLTGRPPRSAGQGEDTRITLPSRAVASTEDLDPFLRQQFSRALRGDLDRILVKALDPEPDQRYPDAATLAADLRRWLEHRPVHATRAGGLYRARKFLARHRGGVAATALLLAAVAAGIAGTLWQSQRALAEARRAEQVKSFLVDLLRSASPEGRDGRIEDTAEVLARGARQADAGLAGQPGLRAELLVLIGQLQYELGQMQAAADTLARADAAISGEDGAAVVQRLELAIARGSLHSGSGEQAKARAALESALALPWRRGGERGAKARTLVDLKLALEHARADEREAALARLDEADARVRELGLGDGLPAAAATYRANVGLVLADYDMAMASAREAQRLMAAAGGGSRAREMELQSLVATAAGGLGRADEAAAAHAEVLRLTRAIYPEGHPLVGAKAALLANALSGAGRFEEAEPVSREALAIRRASLEPGSVRLANSLYNHANLLLELGRADEARPLLREAHEAARAAYGEADFRSLLIASALVYALTDAGRHDQASALLDEVCGQVEAAYRGDGKPHPVFAAVGGRCIRSLVELGLPDHALAVDPLVPARAVTAEGDERHMREAFALRALLDLDRVAEASARAEGLAALIAEATPAPAGRYAAEAHVALGRVALAEGRADAARTALAAAEAALGGERAPERVAREITWLREALGAAPAGAAGT